MNCRLISIGQPARIVRSALILMIGLGAMLAGQARAANNILLITATNAGGTGEGHFVLTVN